MMHKCATPCVTDPSAEGRDKLCVICASKIQEPEFPDVTFQGIPAEMNTLAYTPECSICKSLLWAGQIVRIMGEKDLAHESCLQEKWRKQASRKGKSAKAAVEKDLTWSEIDEALKKGEVSGVPAGVDLEEFWWQTEPTSRKEIEARNPGRKFKAAAWAKRAMAAYVRSRRGRGS